MNCMADLLSPVDRPSEPALAPRVVDRCTGVLRRSGTLARANWLFLIVLGLGAVGRALAMVAYSPALMYIDSYR